MNFRSQKKISLVISDSLKDGSLLKILRSPYSIRWAKSIFDYVMLDKNCLTQHVPWVSYKAREWLDTYLKPSMRVFEYGSGGSTIFFGMRVKEVVTIEHDLYWATNVRRRLRKLSNVSVLYCKPVFEPIANPDFADPNGFRSSVYPELNFANYVKTIRGYPDNYFNLISVDGRSRPSCIFYARDKLLPGGYLFIDDYIREHYKEARMLLTDWKKTDLSGPGPFKIELGYSVVYQKPS